MTEPTRPDNAPSYYVPSIEEFHVGFEYEFKNHLDKFIGATVEEDWATPPYSSNIYTGDIRVKYLDRSDIEELGWKEKTWYNYSGYFGMEVNDKEYTLGFHSNDPASPLSMRVDIIRNDYGNNVMLFQGIIKNKSELKKIMQMVKIGRE